MPPVLNLIRRLSIFFYERLIPAWEVIWALIKLTTNSKKDGV